jgi:hypothetical protein
MLDSVNLFVSAPVTVLDVIKVVFGIFSENWRPLIVLTGFSFAAYVGTFLVLLIATFVIGAEEIALLKQAGQMMTQSQGNYGGYGRHLLDYSTGIIGTYRFLDNYYDYSHDEGFDESYYTYQNINWGIFALTSIFIYILWVIAISLVASVFSGAMVHATAEIYAGNVPVVQNCLQRGWAKKWTIFGYQFIVAVSNFLFFIIAFVLPVAWDLSYEYYAAEDDVNPVKIVSIILLAAFIFVAGFVIINTLLVAAVPSIMCEQTSTVEAFKRSFQLCKNYICFIIGSYFTYQLILIGTIVIVNLILSVLPGAISAIGHLFTNVITTTMGPILSFVLYMSMRIRSEQLTQEEFANEIGSSVPVAHAVELMNAGGGYEMAKTVEVL